MRFYKRKPLISLAILSILIVAIFILRGYFFNKAIVAFKIGQFDKAVSYFKPLAYLGVSDAQYFMGQSYIFGLGIETDVEKGIYWLKKSSNKKNCKKEECIAGQLYYIGEAYLEGRFGVPDKDEAIKWISWSAKNGYQRAIEFLQNHPQEQKE